MTYNKLIRDKIPEMIEQNGGKAVIRQLSHEEFVRFLEMKLDEEVGEYHSDKTVEELADILEVVYALAAVNGFSQEGLNAVYQRKHCDRGGFEKRYFLISSENPSVR